MSNHLELEGTIVFASKGIFRVLVNANGSDEPGQEIQCTIGGKLRKHKINLTIGDQVKIKVSPYDLSRGFIVYRK